MSKVFSYRRWRKPSRAPDSRFHKYFPCQNRNNAWLIDYIDWQKDLPSLAYRSDQVVHDLAVRIVQSIFNTNSRSSRPFGSSRSVNSCRIIKQIGRVWWHQYHDKYHDRYRDDRWVSSISPCYHHVPSHLVSTVTVRDWCGTGQNMPVSALVASEVWLRYRLVWWNGNYGQV